MTINMTDDHVESVAQLKELVKLGRCVRFESREVEETYEWIGRTLGRFRYFRESKKNRGIVKEYLMTMTGYSESQIDKLIRRKKDIGSVVLKTRTQYTFPKIYTPSDIVLLSETALVSQYPNGFALRQNLSDMYRIYRDPRFERLANISVSHIYNLRRTNIWKSRALNYTKTKPASCQIGERRKPQPEGKPGFLRVDSVHQGDLDKEKGVYHINLVDEITQFEIVGCVEGISEEFLLPLLEALLKQFPFRIFNFHSDNGSEYINKLVAKLLNKLMIEQTKSRPRKSNDNGLAETKNGAIVRKYMGYAHIQKKHAKTINEFYEKYLNSYLNFHRHSGYPTDYVDLKGKIQKKYETYLTPVQKLLSIPDVEEYLLPGVKRESLIREQMRIPHLEAAKQLQTQKSILFNRI